MAALECHRKGHTVRVYERSPSASAGGASSSVIQMRYKRAAVTDIHRRRHVYDRTKRQADH